MPNELKEELDKLYASKNPFRMKIMDRFSDISYSEHPIKIIITHDQKMAEEIKKKAKNMIN